MKPETLDASRPRRALVLVFLAALLGVPVMKMVRDGRQGLVPAVLVPMTRPPTSAFLHGWEREMENDDGFVRWVRSWYPLASFLVLRDTTGNVIEGREGWFFYKRSVDALTQQSEVWDPPGLERHPVAGIRHLQQRLAESGVRLVVVPIPNKESIYPDRLAGVAPGAAGPACLRTRRFLGLLSTHGIPCVDLFGVLSALRGSSSPEPGALYLRHDSHWSPRGAQASAQAVAQWLRRQGWLAAGAALPASERATIPARQDLFQMIRPGWQPAPPDVLELTRKPVAPGTSRPNTAPPVWVLGDSFLEYYQAEQAGFGAQLARELDLAVEEICVFGSSAAAADQLLRRLDSGSKPAVVVWVFAERKLSMATGIEGDWTVAATPAQKGAPSATEAAKVPAGTK